MIKILLVSLNLAFLLLSSAASYAYFEPLVKGRLVIENDYYRLIPEGTSKKLDIVIFDDVVRARLRCLKSGDFLTGNALSINGQQVHLQSIDYVGIQQLVGTWSNEVEVFRFDDFRNFQYWNFNAFPDRYNGPFSYHYALSPAGEDPTQCSWKIFIIDSIGVTLGTLEWSAENQIDLQVYDSETGEVTSSKRLIRRVL